jgi:hypothetical protein
MANPIAKTKSDIKAGLKHPVALLLFGMVFAAFAFPMIASWLGKVKAKGGTFANLIPAKFASGA